MGNISFWQGKPFDYAEENYLKREIKLIFNNFKIKSLSEDLYICFSYSLGNTELDFTLFSKNIILILDFKNYQEDIDGYVNGDWFNTLPFGEKNPIRRDKNPFQQSVIQRSKVTKLILDNSYLDKPVVSINTYSGILFKQKINIGPNIKNIISENPWFVIYFFEEFIEVINFLNTKPSTPLNLNFEKILTSIGLKKETESPVFSYSKPAGTSKKEIERSTELNGLLGIPLEKNLLIRAGAGTGKTNFLIERVLELNKKGVPLNRCNLITFTKKASIEILDRLVSRITVDQNIINPFVNVGTIHSFCYRLIGQNWDYFGYTKNPIVINEKKAEKIINMIALNNNFQKHALFHKLFSFCTSRYGSEILNRLDEDLNIYLNGNLEKINLELFNKIFYDYRNYLIKNNIVCYDLIQILANEYLRSEISKGKISFQYLFVDEFQDITKLELDIFQNIHDIHKVYLCLIGDPYQAIYAFRGSLLDSFEKAAELFPGIIVNNLSFNSRSGIKIVDFLNIYLKKNYQEISENELLKPYRNEIGKLEICKFENDNDEANYIVNRVKEAILNENIKPYEIAILARMKLDYCTDKIKKMLKESGIEISIPPLYLRNIDFVEKLFNFLEAMYHDKPDIEAIRKIQEFYPQSISKNFLEIFQRTDLGNTWDSIILYLESFKKNSDLINKNDILWLLSILKETQEIKKQENNLSYLIMLFKDKIHEPFMTLIEKNNIDFINMVYEKLFKIVENFEEKKEKSNDIISKFSEATNEVLVTESNQNGLNINTIHSAKGLEWKIVFVMAPYQENLKWGYSNEEMSLKEEKNIIYVGLTRAVDELNLIFSKRKNLKENKVSEFLEDFYIN